MGKKSLLILQLHSQRRFRHEGMGQDARPHRLFKGTFHTLFPFSFPFPPPSSHTNTHPLSQIRFLADPDARWAKALGVTFDASALLGNFRSKRYALTTEDGKFTKVAIEPDNIGINVSAVDNVLA